MKLRPFHLRFRDDLRDTVASYRSIAAPGALQADLGAGIAVACVALPLNLALALACGLPASAGIVSGVIAGFVGGLLGSARLQVTGPEIALAPISFEIVQRHGVRGLVIATFLAGLLQIALGLTGVARVFSTLPSPVVTGFMAAIGILVVLSQTPRLLGMPADVRSLVDLVRDPSLLAEARTAGVLLGVVVVATMLLLPRVHRRIPAPLVALAIVGAAFAITRPAIPVVGEVAVRFPAPSLPSLHAAELARLLPEAVALALLASLDSMLSASALDALSRGKRHSGDQELVAQGLANMASAAFGGMPVAGAIVRSTAALQAGAVTRLAPIAQAGALLAIGVAGAALTARIPIAALAAVLLVVGVRLIDVRAIVRLARVSRFEVAVSFTTALAIVVTDFVVGVLVGSVVALAHFAHTHRDLGLEIEVLGDDEIHVAKLEGPLFFASHTRLDSLEPDDAAPRVLVLDLRRVRFVDSTGARSLARIVATLRARGSTIAVVAHEAIAHRLVHGEVLAAAGATRLHGSLAAALEDLSLAPAEPVTA